MIAIALVTIIPFVGLVAWSVGLIVYGYKHGILGSVKDQEFGPQDFWVGGPHGGNININVPHYDSYTPPSPPPVQTPKYLGTNVINDVVHTVTGLDIKNGKFDG